MLAPMWVQRLNARNPRLRLLWPFVAVVITYFLFFGLAGDHKARRTTSALVQKHVDRGAGTGGRWYIPPSWLEQAQALGNETFICDLHPKTVLGAAQLALELALVTQSFAARSRIPLIAHQTWRSLKTPTWPEIVQHSVQSWLSAATLGNSTDHADMAYIMWDDNGIDQLMKAYEPTLWGLFQALPYPVEKADIFRVAVVRWFGGFYADVDVDLLQSPEWWVHAGDVLPWKDPKTDVSHGPDDTSMYTSSSNDPSTFYYYQIPMESPSAYQEIISRGVPSENGLDEHVGAIFGIECDTDPLTNTYWRMGYSHAIQLTNWAMASAPLHPAASTFLSQVTSEIKGNISVLPSIDPLDLTGPPALTKAVKGYANSVMGTDFRWDGLTGLHDAAGGRGKVVAGDVLILPITGFSPGRGRLNNMGSMPLTHENARLAHMAQGSWRKTNLKVVAGKLCRSMLGMCRDWKKIP